ncbi:hypothetical protein ACJMK2_001898 [Sinanodonta woodiana]|uniref:Uncharacterized protein n=1 Tax=Sinanodonta woodiana TaxID=1069815 RepID=A0ABD3XVG4_SINWO
MIILQYVIFLFAVGCFLFVGSDADCIEYIAEKRQREGIMAKFTPITAEGCVQTCEQLNTCFAVNYFRLNATCQLLNRTMPESKLIKTTKCLYKAIRRPSQESIDNDPCFKLTCPWDEICMHNTTTNLPECYPLCESPPAIPGTLNETVEIEVSQNYTYKCRDGLLEKIDQTSTVTCLKNGHWTGTNFTCVCESPPVIKGTINETIEIEVSQNYTYKCWDGLFGKIYQISTVTCLKDGHWTGTNFTCVCKYPPAIPGTLYTIIEKKVGQIYTYKCQTGLVAKAGQNPTVTCLADGSWTSTMFACVGQNWLKDTIYLNNIQQSIEISNETGINMLACMLQCDEKMNICLSFFYDNRTNHCILSSSFRRGLPQGYTTSNGFVYYTAPSTSCDMGYSNVNLGGSYFCIKLHRATQTFNEGMKICESEKAKLLIVTTEAQITATMTFLEILHDYVYIGLSYEINEGHWVSWDGEEVSIFWGSSTSQTADINGDCGVILGLAMPIGVFNHTCSHSHSFICCKNYF